MTPTRASGRCFGRGQVDHPGREERDDQQEDGAHAAAPGRRDGGHRRSVVRRPRPRPARRAASVPRRGRRPRPPPAAGPRSGGHARAARRSRGSTPRARLAALDLAGDDDEVLRPARRDGAGLRWPSTRPSRCPNESGRRDVEAVLAWCDVAAFPVSRRRLETVHGGARGVDARARARAPGPGPRWRPSPTRCCARSPGSATHPPGAPAMDLAEYRAAWIGVRAPVYRPKGIGRARPHGHPRRLAPAGRRPRPRRLGARARRRRLGGDRRRRPHRRPLLRLRRACWPRRRASRRW